MGVSGTKHEALLSNSIRKNDACTLVYMYYDPIVCIIQCHVSVTDRKHCIPDIN